MTEKRGRPKKEPTTIISIRVTKDIKQKLKDKAKDNNKSLSDFLLGFILKGIK